MTDQPSTDTLTDILHAMQHATRRGMRPVRYTSPASGVTWTHMIHWRKAKRVARKERRS